MNCWHCNAELIWGGDHDTEDNEYYDIVSNLSCPKCHTAVDVWHPSEKLIKEQEDYDKKSMSHSLYVFLIITPVLSSPCFQFFAFSLS